MDTRGTCHKGPNYLSVRIKQALKKYVTDLIIDIKDNADKET